MVEVISTSEYLNSESDGQQGKLKRCMLTKKKNYSMITHPHALKSLLNINESQKI